MAFSAPDVIAAILLYCIAIFCVWNLVFVFRKRGIIVLGFGGYQVMDMKKSPVAFWTALAFTTAYLLLIVFLTFWSLM